MSGAMQAALRDPWLGRIIEDRYEVLEVLGEGGMGLVYVAEHLKLRKKVALKVIHSRYIGVREVSIRFAREAMAASRIDHPHIVGVLDYGTFEDGGAYLVMQLVRGDSLHRRLDAGPISWRRVAAIGEQVADALAAAHSAGIVHRDLKPENILLESRDDGTVLARVLDFGVARVALEEDQGPKEAEPGQNLTRLGTVVGTPGYMAPEQATGEPVDPRADLYSLGVVLWEAIAGKPLFSDRELTKVLHRQLLEKPPRLDLAVPGVAPGLADLVEAMLAQAPEDRPESASVVRDRLREYAYASVDSLAPGKIDKADVTAQTVLARVSQPVRRARDIAKERPGIAVAGVALAIAGVLCVAGAVAFAMDSEAAVTKVVEVKRERPRTRTAVRPPPAPVEVPAAGDDVTTMLESQNRRERRAAAERVRADGDAAEWALAAASLELASGCRSRSEALAEIRRVGDARALPVVRRLANTPRSGCGFLGFSDCYDCVRSDLAQTLTALESP